MPTRHTVTTYKFNELSEKAKEKAREWYRELDSVYFDADDFKEHTLVEPAAYHHRVKTEHCYYSLNYCQGDGVAYYGEFDLDFFMAVPEHEPPGGGELAADRKHIQEMIRKLQVADVTINITIRGQNERYHHYNSMSVDMECEESSLPKASRLSAWFDAADWSLGVDGPGMREAVNAALFLNPDDDTVPLVALDWFQDKGVDTEAARAIFMTDEEYIDLQDDIVKALDAYMTSVSHSMEEAGYAELEYRDSDEVVDDNITGNDYEFTEDGRRFVPPKKPKRVKRGKQTTRADAVPGVRGDAPQDGPHPDRPAG